MKRWKRCQKSLCETRNWRLTFPSEDLLVSYGVENDPGFRREREGTGSAGVGDEGKRGDPWRWTYSPPCKALWSGGPPSPPSCTPSFSFKEVSLAAPTRKRKQLALEKRSWRGVMIAESKRRPGVARGHTLRHGRQRRRRTRRGGSGRAEGRGRARTHLVHDRRVAARRRGQVPSSGDALGAN